MKILPNTLVKFQADYIDDDSKPTKARYHLVIKVDEIKKEVLLLKITSQWKNFFWQGKLGSVKCLTKPSFVIYNRIIFFDLTTLKFNNPRKFRICSIHRSGCLEKKRFVKIVRKLENFWNNPFNRGLLKIRLDWNSLKATEAKKLIKNKL